MAETDEETLPRRALQVAKGVKYVVRVESELVREALRADTERELLLDPAPLLVIEARELFLECRIADHDIILSPPASVRLNGGA